MEYKNLMVINDVSIDVKTNWLLLACFGRPTVWNGSKMAYTQEDNRAVKQKKGFESKRQKNISMGDWDKVPASEEYLTELLRVSKDQIIFGINYMDFSFERR